MKPSFLKKETRAGNLLFNLFPTRGLCMASGREKSSGTDLRPIPPSSGSLRPSLSLFRCLP